MDISDVVKNITEHCSLICLAMLRHVNKLIHRIASGTPRYILSTDNEILDEVALYGSYNVVSYITSIGFIPSKHQVKLAMDSVNIGMLDTLDDVIIGTVMQCYKDNKSWTDNDVSRLVDWLFVNGYVWEYVNRRYVSYDVLYIMEKRGIVSDGYILEHANLNKERLLRYFCWLAVDKSRHSILLRYISDDRIKCSMASDELSAWKDLFGLYPDILSYIARSGSIVTMEHFVKSGFTLYKNSATMLAAIHSDDVNMVMFLVSMGVSCSVYGSIAFTIGSINVIKYMLSSNESLCIDSCIRCAVNYDQYDVVKYMYDNGYRYCDMIIVWIAFTDRCGLKLFEFICDAYRTMFIEYCASVHIGMPIDHTYHRKTMIVGNISGPYRSTMIRGDDIYAIVSSSKSVDEKYDMIRSTGRYRFADWFSNHAARYSIDDMISWMY